MCLKTVWSLNLAIHFKENIFAQEKTVYEFKKVISHYKEFEQRKCKQKQSSICFLKELLPFT